MKPSSFLTRLSSRRSLAAVSLGAVLFVGTHTVYNQIPKAAHSTPNVTVSASSLPELASLPTPSLARPAVPSGKPNILAKSYILIDSTSKYPLAAKAADTPVPIASTTKVMTALVALDTYPNLDTVLTIPKEAAGITGSEINLMTGEKLTVKNLLYAMMLNSANDAAYALALGQSDKAAFVAKMNTKAELLGLKNTHYQDPAGLDDTGHSTPHDLALLMDYALKNPTFRTIVNTATTTIWSADQRYKHDLKNSNRLIQADDPLYYSPVLGGKTGFTFEAGHCLIAVADYSPSKRHIAVVLHTSYETPDASAREARKLLVWGTGN